MGASGPGGSLPRIALLLLLALSGARAQRAWFKQLPPNNYYEPDVDVTSPTPLPRIPISPYHMQADNCPQQDGIPYQVDGYPGTPFLQTPFSRAYHSAPQLQPSVTVCRNGVPDPKHCMSAYEVTIDRVQSRPFDTTVPACVAFPPTELLGYNGISPGPTITAAVGHETLVRFTNRITGPLATNPTGGPCAGTRTGRPTTVHLHGSASLAPYDGWAEDATCGGETKDYVYPNQRAGSSWYHDHALHITLGSVYHGLAGFYLMSDKLKDGGCGAPYNLEDIEERLVILSDAVLTPDCQLYYDYFGPHNRNLYGDINLINGIPWPEMRVEPKWMRFRFLNAAVARPFMIKFKNDFGRDIGPEICRVIASEGGYRADPIPFPREGLQMAVAERYEVVCNFETYAGRNIYMWNGRNNKMMDGVPYYCYSHLLSLITVAPSTAVPNPPAFNELDVPPTPLYLDRVLTPADVAAAQQLIALDQPTRSFVFGRNGGLWTINGETWDSATIAASDVGQNTWELWRIRTGGGWFHPIHMHLVDFFILQRGDRGTAGVVDGLFSYERNSAKDIIYLGPGQEMWLVARFGPHRGNYMFHCHNLVHEDHDMMRAYTVVGGAGLDNLPVANPASTLPINMVAGVIYNNWGYNDPRYAAASARPTATWPAITPAYVQSVLDQNLYRIFYAEATDLPALQAPSNPWAGTTCQTLPLLPAVPGATPTPELPTPAEPEAPILAPVPVPVRTSVPAPAPEPTYPKDKHSKRKKQWSDEMEEEDPYDMFG